MNAYMSEDIQPVDILEQVDRWELTLPSLNRRRYLEKALIKKYTKLRVFSAVVNGEVKKPMSKAV